MAASSRGTTPPIQNPNPPTPTTSAPSVEEVPRVSELASSEDHEGGNNNDGNNNDDTNNHADAQHAAISASSRAITPPIQSSDHPSPEASAHGVEEATRVSGQASSGDHEDGKSNSNNNNTDDHADAQHADENPDRTSIEDPASPTSPTSPIAEQILPDGDEDNSALSDVADEDLPLSQEDEELLDAAANDPGKIPELLRNGANASVISPSGKSLLRILIKRGFKKGDVDTITRVLPEILQFIKPGHIDAQYAEDTTVLIYTICKGPLNEFLTYRHDIIELLITKGNASIDIKDEQGCTALDWASRLGYTDIAKLLLDHNADVNVQDAITWTPLHTAVTFGHHEVVKLLLGKNPDINAQTIDGRTALNMAARNGSHEMVKLLLENNANGNIQDSQGWTALESAARYGHHEVVKSLLDKSADVNVQDSDGWTALKVAAKRGHSEVVKLLLKVDGIKFDLPDNEQRTPLMEATYWRHKEIVSTLLSHGAQVKAADKNECTPLSEASHEGYKDIVEILLSAKPPCDLNAGWPIHKAAANGHTAVVKMLLDCRADITKGNKDGETPLHIASRKGYASIVQLLLQHSPDIVNIKNSKGETPLHVAVPSRDSCGQPTSGAAPSGDDDTPGQASLVMRRLLDYHADYRLLTKDNQTVFHRLALSDNAELIRLVTSKKPPATSIAYLFPGLESINLITASIQDSTNRTAMGLASKYECANSLRELLLYFETVDWGAYDAEEETLLWLAKNPDTHDIIALVLKYAKRAPVDGETFQPKWDALTLAAYYGEWKLLKCIVDNMVPHPGNKARIKKAEAMVRRIMKAASRDTQKKKSTEGHSNPSPEALRIKDGSDAASAYSGPRSTYGVDEEEDKSNLAAEEDDLAGTKVESKTKKDNVAQSLEKYPRVLDVLLNPPIVETSAIKLVYAKPETKLEFPSFYASIIDFYAQDGLAFLRRLRDVKEVIYDTGPKEIMESARKAIKGKTAPTQTTDKKNPERDFTLRWIHLPANNLQWMEDLALRMFIDDGEPKDAYEELYDLLHGSWHEVPHASFESKFMKPVCSTKLGPRWGGKGKPKNEAAKSSPTGEAGENEKNITTAQDEVTVEEEKKEKAEAEKKKKDEAEKKKKAEENKCQIALYMPYITFSIQKKDETDESREYHDLLTLCKNRNVVIHGSRTLDEFYYHFQNDKESEKERELRNRDQVVTVELNNGSALEKESKSWTILRVDQLWLWVLNEKYIITSSTHRMDNVDDIVPSAIISYLTNNSRSKTQPNSAVALTKLIVDFCIGFFNHLQADTDTKPEAGHSVQKLKGRRSTQQIFSNAINRASIKEAELFRNFVNRHDRNKVPRKSQAGNKSQASDKDQEGNKSQASDKDQEGDENKSNDTRLQSIEEAACLLRDVKDIRDELNILRLIASYQRTVQDSLPTSAGTTHIDRNAKTIAANIEELDKLAKKIEGAVNATLSVEQSAVAIEQSKETVQQGRTLMTFTIVTILFLPISFLTSLFSLNISLFQQGPDGDLSYTPAWIFPRLIGLSLAVWVPTLLWAFPGKLPKKRIRELLADLRPSPNPESDAKTTIKMGWRESLREVIALRRSGGTTPVQRDEQRKRPSVDLEAGKEE